MWNLVLKGLMQAEAEVQKHRAGISKDQANDKVKSSPETYTHARGARRSKRLESKTRGYMTTWYRTEE